MLELRKVEKTFGRGSVNETYALRGVSLAVEDGTFVVVVGTNGSGKSTLQGAIAGTFRVDSGSIHLGGHDLTSWPEHARARHIGRVFQNPFSGTAPGMTIAENLSLAARRGHGLGLGPLLSRRIRDEIRSRLRMLAMGLEERLDTPIGTLSGGQRQALTLLMATWNRPDVLLLDEHTAALDPKSADQVVRLTRDLVARESLTTLMVTHSMQQAAALGDRIVMMHAGRVVADFSGARKRELRREDLLDLFEEIRRADLLDATAAEMLRQRYV